MPAQTSERLPVNRWPLNQLSKVWLLKAHEHPSPDSPYWLQLVSLGLEQRLPTPGPASNYRHDLELAAGRLHSPNMDPVKVTRWLAANPNGPAPPEQNMTILSELQSARTWQEAAGSLIETFFDRLNAENPYYDHPANELT